MPTTVADGDDLPPTCVASPSPSPADIRVQERMALNQSPSNSSSAATATRASAAGRRAGSATTRSGGSLQNPRSSITSSIHHAHKHREGTVVGATLNTLCNVMGAGVLSLPFAMYNGSIVISLILLAISSILSAFSVYALAYACEVTHKFSYTECLSFSLFPDQALAADTRPDDDVDEGIYDEHESLPRKRRRWITMCMEVMIFLNSFGTLVIYSRVIADSIPPVLENFFGASGVWTAEWLWLLAPSCFFFVLSCARSMEELKWTSLLGFITILYVVILVILRYFTNISDPISTDPAAKEIKTATISIGCFSTLSAYALAFGYHYNVPYFYSELYDRRPSVLMETVKNAFPIITASYGCTGLLGYLIFGALVASHDAEGDIMNNFSKQDAAANVGRLGLFFHFLSVYPIMSVCARRGLHRFICLCITRPMREERQNGDVVRHSRFEPAPGDPSTTSMRSIILEAFGIVAFSTVIAAFVPGIGVVVELIGSLLGVPLMFIFPGIIGMKIFRPGIQATEHLKIDFWYRVSVFTAGIGIVFLICGLIAFGIERK